MDRISPSKVQLIPTHTSSSFSSSPHAGPVNQLFSTHCWSAPPVAKNKVAKAKRCTIPSSSFAVSRSQTISSSYSNQSRALLCDVPGSVTIFSPETRVRIVWTRCCAADNGVLPRFCTVPCSAAEVRRPSVTRPRTSPATEEPILRCFVDQNRACSRVRQCDHGVDVLSRAIVDAPCQLRSKSSSSSSP